VGGAVESFVFAEPERSFGVPPKLETIAGMGGGFRRAQTLGSFMLQ
jgi:hypothetical protein